MVRSTRRGRDKRSVDAGGGKERAEAAALRQRESGAWRRGLVRGRAWAIGCCAGSRNGGSSCSAPSSRLARRVGPGLSGPLQSPGSAGGGGFGGGGGPPPWAGFGGPW